jgi:hypothetical protein
MEEAPENGKESSHSAHANGMNGIFQVNEEVAYRCINKDQIRKLDRYCDQFMYKWFNKTKEI